MRILEYTSNELIYAWDTINTPTSLAMFADPLTPDGGTRCACQLKPDLPHEFVAVEIITRY
jgi:hypothetical protein